MPFEPRPSQPAYTLRPQSAPYQAESAERSFFAAVYRWMTLGLVTTALVAWVVAGALASGALPFSKWAFYGLMFAEVGLVFALSGMAHRLSAAAAGGLFLLYSALNGATLSIILLVYTGSSVALAFGVTAGTFGAMSVYGTVTRKDLTGWSSFLMMGLFGVVIAGLVNLFLQSDMLSFVVSCAAVVVFTGLTAYDTQKLRVFARAGGPQVAAAPVVGALTLYLDFVNLFLALLRLLGDRRK